MPSKQVADRQKAAISVLAAIDAHAETLESKMQASLAPHLVRGEKLPSVSMLVVLASRSLRAATDEMVAADAAHEAELTDDARPRRARDEAATKLCAAVGEIKEVVTGLLGAPALELLSLGGIVPREPMLLAQHVEVVVARIRGVKLPKSRVPGATFAAEKWAKELEATATPLRRALADVAREAREAEATVVKKRASIERFDAVFSQQAGLVSALLVAAGEPEHAARLRPTLRKTGRATEAPVVPLSPEPVG